MSRYYVDKDALAEVSRELAYLDDIYSDDPRVEKLYRDIEMLIWDYEVITKCLRLKEDEQACLTELTEAI